MAALTANGLPPQADPALGAKTGARLQDLLRAWNSAHAGSGDGARAAATDFTAASDDELFEAFDKGIGTLP